MICPSEQATWWGAPKEASPGCLACEDCWAGKVGAYPGPSKYARACPPPLQTMDHSGHAAADSITRWPALPSAGRCSCPPGHRLPRRIQAADLGHGVQHHAASLHRPGHRGMDVRHMEIDAGARAARHVALPSGQRTARAAAFLGMGKERHLVAVHARLFELAPQQSPIKTHGPRQVVHRDLEVGHGIHQAAPSVLSKQEADRACASAGGKGPTLQA